MAKRRVDRHKLTERGGTTSLVSMPRLREHPFQQLGRRALFAGLLLGVSTLLVWFDRAAYISVTIPAKYPGGNVMPPLATALGKALPPVCSTDPTAPLEKLCTRRK